MVSSDSITGWHKKNPLKTPEKTGKKQIDGVLYANHRVSKINQRL
jgi:hypothetical protein